MLNSTITKGLRIANQFPFISWRKKGNHIRGVLLCVCFFFPSKMLCSNEVVIHYNCLFQIAYSILRVLIKAFLKYYLWWTFCDVSSSPTRSEQRARLQPVCRGIQVHPSALIWPGVIQMCVAWH